jgi:hypothetical protein
MWLYNYEFELSLCKIVRSSVILLLPLLYNQTFRGLHLTGYGKNRSEVFGHVVSNRISMEKQSLRCCGFFVFIQKICKI